MCSIFDRDGEAVRPEDGLHLVGEGRDVLAGDEEGGRVEQIDENLHFSLLCVNMRARAGILDSLN